ncbi:hypothetical protein HDU96_010072 [Phlyctochytrium bullatum]|nr:hypothetical protein HDU96_010072 [Phlyctochytrium bullatum]
MARDTPRKQNSTHPARPVTPNPASSSGVPSYEDSCSGSSASWLCYSILAAHNVRPEDLPPVSVLSANGPRALPGFAAFLHPTTAALAPFGAAPGLQNIASNPLSTGTHVSPGITQENLNPAGPAPNALTCPGPSTIAAMSGGHQRGTRNDESTEVLQRPTGGKDNPVSKTRKKKKAAPSPSELQAPAPAPAPAPAAEAGTSTATLNLASVTLGFSAQQLERAVAGGRVHAKKGKKKGHMQLIYWHELFPTLLDDASQDHDLEHKFLAAIQKFVKDNCSLAGLTVSECNRVLSGDSLNRRDTLGLQPVVQTGQGGGSAAQVALPTPENASQAVPPTTPSQNPTEGGK